MVDANSSSSSTSLALGWCFCCDKKPAEHYFVCANDACRDKDKLSTLPTLADSIGSLAEPRTSKGMGKGGKGNKKGKERDNSCGKGRDAWDEGEEDAYSEDSWGDWRNHIEQHIGNYKGGKGKGKGKGNCKDKGKGKNKRKSKVTQIPIPPQMVGIVIGKGGETIKTLQAIPGVSSVWLQKQGEEELFGGRLAMESDLMVCGSDAAIRRICEEIEGLKRRFCYGKVRDFQNTSLLLRLHIDAERSEAIKFVLADLDACAANFHPFGKRKFFALVPSAKLVNVPQQVDDNCTRFVLQETQLENDVKDSALRAREGARPQILVRLGVLLFSNISDGCDDLWTPASWPHLQPYNCFKTQFSQFLDEGLVSNLVGTLREEGFKMLRDCHRTDIHLQCMHRDALRHPDNHLGYVLSLIGDSLGIENGIQLSNIDCIRSTMQRLLNADICMVELGLALRIAVSACQGCSEQKHIFLKALQGRARETVALGESLELEGDQYKIKIIRRIYETVWSDGNVEVKISDVREESELHYNMIVENMEVAFSSPALDRALREDENKCSVEGIRLFTSLLHRIKCLVAEVNSP